MRGTSEGVGSLLAQAGLPTHDAAYTCGGDMLGWSFSAEQPCVAVGARAAWRLRLGLLGLADRGHATRRALG
eukprot:7751407-Alexandrium_andersonii.AAC.1